MELEKINEELPEHDKTSCDDINLQNKGFSFDGGYVWCRRCMALYIHRLENERNKNEPPNN